MTYTSEQRSIAGRIGARKAMAQRRAEKREGMAAAIAWRESGRCPDCRALAYQPCAHRPDGCVRS